MNVLSFRVLAATCMLFVAGRAVVGHSRTAALGRLLRCRRGRYCRRAFRRSLAHIGAAPVVVVEHFGGVGQRPVFANVDDKTTFRDFLKDTAMVGAWLEMLHFPGGQSRGFIPREGGCIAFSFFKRL